MRNYLTRLFSSISMADVDTVGLWHFDEGEGTVVHDSGAGGYDGNCGSGSSAPAWWGADNWSNEFDYDDAGNREHWYRTIGTTTTTHTYTYNTLNQLATWSYTVSGYTFLHTFTYDANGNRVKDVETVNSNVNNTYVYRWNQDNQLIKYQHYARSGQDDILQKTVKYRYCRTCGGQRSERIEKDGNGAIVEWLRYEMEGLNHWRIDEKYDSDEDEDIDADDGWRIQRYYVNGSGQLGQIVKAAVYDYSGEEPVSTDYYYGYDVLGNVSVISDGDGEEADQFEQDAFGNEVEYSWQNAIGGVTEHLTTKQYDADLGPNGLYYFLVRWYDPIIGSFLSKDPIRGEKSYAFTNNCPINSVDPSGKLSFGDVINAIGNFLCPCGAQIRQDAIDMANGWCPQYGMQDDTQVNAFVHCFVACEVARQCGSFCALGLDSRETPHTGGASEMKNEMDLHNNAEGRDCAIRIQKEKDDLFSSGSVNPPIGMPDEIWTSIQPCSSCRSCCRDKLFSGELMYIQWKWDYAPIHFEPFLVNTTGVQCLKNIN